MNYDLFLLSEFIVCFDNSIFFVLLWRIQILTFRNVIRPFKVLEVMHQTGVEGLEGHKITNLISWAFAQLSLPVIFLKDCSLLLSCILKWTQTVENTASQGRKAGRHSSGRSHLNTALCLSWFARTILVWKSGREWLCSWAIWTYIFRL